MNRLNIKIHFHAAFFNTNLSFFLILIFLEKYFIDIEIFNITIVLIAGEVKFSIKHITYQNFKSKL